MGAILIIILAARLENNHKNCDFLIGSREIDCTGIQQWKRMGRVGYEVLYTI
jgi:hypothetical protein